MRLLVIISCLFVLCLSGCGGGGDPVNPELNIENFTGIYVGTTLVAPRVSTSLNLTIENTITFQLIGNIVATDFNSTIRDLDIRLVNIDRGVTLFVNENNIDTLGNITVNPLGNQIIFTFNDNLDSIELGGSIYYIDPDERMRIEVHSFDADYEDGSQMNFGNNESWFAILNSVP